MIFIEIFYTTDTFRNPTKFGNHFSNMGTAGKVKEPLNENEAGGLTVTLMSSCPFYITEA